MSLEIELIKEACKKFWEQYHVIIEKEGYSLRVDSFWLSPDDFIILAAIGNNCPEKKLAEFREALPMEFTYENGNQSRTYSVAVGPTIKDMFDL